MKRFLPLLSLIPGSLMAIQLQFTPDVTVEQRHTAIVAIEQDLPHGEDHSRMEQIVDVELRLPSTGSLEPVQQPPFELQLVVKRVQMKMKKGERTVSFDTANASQIRDPFVARLIRLVGRPLDLKIGADWALEANSKELARFLHEIPSLNSYLSPSFFHAFLQPVIALAGEELTEGDSVDRSTLLGQHPGTPVPLRYTIQNANLREVEASIEGEVQEQQLSMGEAEAVLAGRTTGKASWTRRHGLEAQLESHEFYDGTIKQENQEWPVKMSVTHLLESKRKGV